MGDGYNRSILLHCCVDLLFGEETPPEDLTESGDGITGIRIDDTRLRQEREHTIDVIGRSLGDLMDLDRSSEMTSSYLISQRTEEY